MTASRGGRRAIFFTLDSFLALVVVGILSFSIMSALSAARPTSFSEGNLVLLSESSLAALEADGTLERALANSSAIGRSLSVAPPSLCWEISVDREDGSRLASERKALCQCDAGRSVFARRGLVIDNGSGVSTRAVAVGRFCFK